jgi:hypothetical protein
MSVTNPNSIQMGLEIQIKEIEQAKTREIQLRSLNKVNKGGGGFCRKKRV